MTDKSPTKLELVVSRFDFFAFPLPYLECYNLAPRQILSTTCSCFSSSFGCDLQYHCNLSSYYLENIIMPFKKE